MFPIWKPIVSLWRRLNTKLLSLIIEKENYSHTRQIFYSDRQKTRWLSASHIKTRLEKYAYRTQTKRSFHTDYSITYPYKFRPGHRQDCFNTKQTYLQCFLGKSSGPGAFKFWCNGAKTDSFTNRRNMRSGWQKLQILCGLLFFLC